jgi:hypothetical protein
MVGYLLYRCICGLVKRSALSSTISRPYFQCTGPTFGHMGGGIYVIPQISSCVRYDLDQVASVLWRVAANFYSSAKSAVLVVVQTVPVNSLFHYKCYFRAECKIKTESCTRACVLLRSDA